MVKVFGEGSEGFPLSLKVSGAISDLLERVSKHSNSEYSTDDPFLLYEFLNNPPLKQFCQIYIQTTSDHSLPIRVAHCAVESSFHILVRQSSASSLQYSQALKIVKSLLYECLEKLIPGLINSFDLNTACLGFLFGVQVDLKVIYSMIESILEIAMKMKAKSEDGMSDPPLLKEILIFCILSMHSNSSTDQLNEPSLQLYDKIVQECSRAKLVPAIILITQTKLKLISNSTVQHYFTSILKLIYYLINHDNCLNLFLAFFETTDIDWNNGQVHVEKVELLANIFIKSIMKSTQNCQEYSVVALNNWISEMLSMKSPLALGVSQCMIVFVQRKGYNFILYELLSELGWDIFEMIAVNGISALDYESVEKLKKCEMLFSHNDFKEDVMHDLKNIIVDLISPWLDKLLHFVSVNARIIENEIYNIIKKFLEMVFYEKKFILIKQQYATLYKQLYEASNDMFDGFKSEETSVETNCNEEDSVVFDSLINVRKAFSLFINIISCIKSQKEEVIIEDVENSILLLSEKIIPLVSCSKKYPKLKPTIDALILSHLKSYYNLLPVLKEIYIVLGSQKPEYLKKTAVFLTNQLHKLYYITDMDDFLAFAEYTFSIIDVTHTLLMQFINQIEDWHSYSTNSNGFDNSLAMANSMESNTAIPPVGEKELSLISSFLGLDQNQISISTTCLNSSDPASFRNNLSYIIEAILYSFTPRTELSLSLDFLLFSLNSKFKPVVMLKSNEILSAVFSQIAANFFNLGQHLISKIKQIILDIAKDSIKSTADFVLDLAVNKDKRTSSKFKIFLLDLFLSICTTRKDVDMSELLIKLLDSQIYKPFDSLLPDSLYLLYRMSDFILHVHTKKNIQTSHKLITMHLEILQEFGMHQMDEEYIMISKVVVRSLTHIVKSFYKSDQRSSIWLTDEEKILISTLTTKLNEDIYKFSKDLIPDIKGLILICQITMKSKPKDINFLNEYKSSKAISNLKNSSSPVYSSNNVSELNESFKSFNLELYEKQ